MRNLGMTRCALRAVGRRHRLQRLMEIVARQTGESAVAVAEACGAVQVSGLVAHVPGIAPVPVIVQVVRLAMAGAAESIDLNGRQPLGVLNRPCAARLGVRAPGPVARFAAHARLTRLDLKIGRQRDRSGRVATEAAQRRGDRIEGAIDQVRRSRVTRRQGQ